MNDYKEKPMIGGYPPTDIGRHVDEVKAIKAGQSTYKAMMAFKQAWTAKLWEATEGRFCLALVDNDDWTSRLWLIDAQAGEVVEPKWDRVPAVDEIVVSAYGECTCPPEGDACPTCGVLRALVDGDELPF